MSTAYQDIIHQHRPPSSRMKMKRQDRAKIFSPFDALDRYTAAIRERDKVLLPKPQLTDSMKSELNQKLTCLNGGDTVTISFFNPQTSIDGELVGDYITVSGTVEKLDALNQAVHLDNFIVIPFEDLLGIQSNTFASFEAVAL